MTLDPKRANSLLESYEDFARRLNCGESTLLSIINSTKTTKEKIGHLMTVIAKEINKYYSWLIIVNDVENLTCVSSLLPQPNDADWNGGQVLITTQDSSHIPPNNSFTAHVSISPGMRESESILLLVMLSGACDDPMLSEVAKTLDYQPLALAAAAVYLKKVRETNVSPEFSWKNYLQKLDEGKRQLTEEVLRDINPNYSLTMTTAVLLAVEKTGERDVVLNHTFHFLSLASHESLPLEVAISYTLEVDKRLDKEQVGFQIRKCSLIIPEDHDVVSIRLHRVVHCAIQVYSRQFVTCKPVMSRRFVVASKLFFNFSRIKKYQKNLIPHFKAFHAAMTRMFPKKTWEFANGDAQFLKIFLHFASVLHHHGEFEISISFLNVTQQILETLKNSEKEFGLHSDNRTKYYDQELVKILNNLALSYREIGRLPQAKNYVLRARDTLLKHHDADQKDLATVFETLGSIYLDLDNIEQARRSSFESSLDLRVKQLGSDHVDVSDSYINLGNVYYSLFDLEQAKRYYELALKCYLKNGVSDLRLPGCFANLGAVYYLSCEKHHRNHDMRQFDNDLHMTQLYQKLAFDIRLKQLGPNHVRVAESYFNMGLIHESLGNLDKAKEYYEKALDIYLKQREANDTKLTQIYYNLGKIHDLMGDSKKAKQYYNRANNSGIKTFQRKWEYFIKEVV